MSHNSGNRLDFVLKTGTFVFIFIVGAKVLNFIKKILVGNLFGISWQADSFFAASYLPYYVAVFFEGVIYLGFIPLFSRVLSEKGKEEAVKFIGEILPWIILLTGALVLAACLGSPWLVREIAPGFKAGSQALTQSLFCIMSVVIVFIALSSFFQSLNSFIGSYLVAASSGMTDSLVMIVITVASYRIWGIYGAAWGAVAGAFTAFSVQAFFLNRSRTVFPTKIYLRFGSFWKLLKILVPLGSIWVFQMIPLVILNRFGSGMWQGTISAISISLGIMIVPTGLVSQTILISIFPSLAKEASEETAENVRETFFKTLRAAFFVLIPVGFLLTGLARPITVLFFAQGGIASEGTERIANSLFCLGWSAFAFYADLFMTQSLITIRKTVPAIILCATRAGLTYGLCYFLSAIWDYRGLAFSFSLGLIVNFLVFFPLFFRLTPLKGKWKELFLYGLKLSFAACPMLLGSWMLKLGPFAMWVSCRKAGMFGGMVLFSALGLAVYLFILRGLKIKEFQSVSEAVKRIWMKKDWWFTETGDV